jgi:hypothetical protein
MADFQKSFSVSIDTKVLDAIAAKLDKSTKQVLKKMAFDVKAEAITLAPHVTGALKSSIVVATSTNSPMPAVPGNPDRVQLPIPEDNMTFHVGPTVNYGEYVEFPGVKRANWQGRPYLIPAFEHQVQRYSDPSQWKEVAKPSGGAGLGDISDISNWTPE